MMDATTDKTAPLRLDYALDAPPEKVWRAISLAEFRRRWLPDGALSGDDGTTIVPGREVRYRLRDSAPPFLESDVTFRITPDPAGGTSLQIVQQLTAESLERLRRAAANDDGPMLMLAA
ncbi:SRPBCC family protein [Rhizobium sp. PAMB 3174]